MTTTELLRTSAALFSGGAARLARGGRTLWNFLSLSLADERIAPGRGLSLLLDNGGISAAYGSRFLSHLRLGGTRLYPFETGKFPTPENLASAAVLAVSHLHAAGAPVTLVLPRGWAIVRRVELPLAVKSHLPDVVSFELDRLTPLSAERAYYDFRVLGEEDRRLRLLLVAVKADTLLPYLDALRERGIGVSRVVASLSDSDAPSHYVHGGGDALFERMNLLEKGAHAAPRTPLALTAVLLAILIAAGGLQLLAPLQVQEKRSELIDREITARKDDIRKVEALKTELAGLEKESATITAFKAARPMIIDLLREMTRILPASVWLSRMRCTGSAIEIEGYAASATEIMPKLEASRYFKKVEFASPTLRDVRMNADRFVIKMEIEGLQEDKPADAKKK